MIVGAVIMLPLGASALPAQIAGASMPALAAAIALALMASALAPVVFLQLVTVAGPSFVAFLNYLIPLWAIVIGVALLGEQPRWTALLALCLILGGLAMSERAWRRRKAEDACRPRDGQADAASAGRRAMMKRGQEGT
jgi:drug/metabolite transporter (DMT)-like permease